MCVNYFVIMRGKIQILAISILLCMLGCARKFGPVDSNSVQPNNKLDTLVSMSATIGGTNFRTDSAFGFNVKNLISDTAVDFNLMINATQKGKNDTVRTISLFVTGYTGPGTYKIAPPAVTATYYFNNQRHFAVYGSINVLSDSNYALVGNFTFLADSIYVSNGVFNVLRPY